MEKHFLFNILIGPILNTNNTNIGRTRRERINLSLILCPAVAVPQLQVRTNCGEGNFCGSSESEIDLPSFVAVLNKEERLEIGRLYLLRAAEPS